MEPSFGSYFIFADTIQAVKLDRIQYLPSVSSIAGGYDIVSAKCHGFFSVTKG